MSTQDVIYPDIYQISRKYCSIAVLHFGSEDNTRKIALKRIGKISMATKPCIYNNILTFPLITLLTRHCLVIIVSSIEDFQLHTNHIRE